MLNQVIQMGRLTADPELKQTQGGTSFVNFSIAVERNYTGGSGKRETDFFDVVAWGGNAEFIARNFSKGKLITIVGSLENSKWEDQAGNKRVSTKINAAQAYFCGDYGDKQQTAQAQAQPQAAPAYNSDYNPYAQFEAPPLVDDDCPF